MNEMPDILKRICAVKREEIARLHTRGLDVEACPPVTGPRGFRAALCADERISLIAEVKRASPSAGLMRRDFDPAAIARAYEAGGARCISVLTDETFFQGSLQDMQAAREGASLPVLRKDFILDEIQLREARACGADCVLLIVAALDMAGLANLLGKTRELGMDALVEVHDQGELDTALCVGADMVGINNRDLRTFQVSRDTTLRLAPMVPEGTVVVSESGIRCRSDVQALKGCGVDAILVGECLMRSPDMVAAARELSDV